MNVTPIRSLGEVIMRAQAVSWQSRARARGLWGFPVLPFADVLGTGGRRWTLTETVGGLCWVRQDRLVEIMGRTEGIR